MKLSQFFSYVHPNTLTKGRFRCLVSVVKPEEKRYPYPHIYLPKASNAGDS